MELYPDLDPDLGESPVMPIAGVRYDVYEKYQLIWRVLNMFRKYLSFKTYPPKQVYSNENDLFSSDSLEKVEDQSD